MNRMLWTVYAHGRHRDIYFAQSWVKAKCQRIPSSWFVWLELAFHETKSFWWTVQFLDPEEMLRLGNYNTLGADLCCNLPTPHVCRTPPLNFSSVGGTLNQDRELYLGNTICTQRNLDDTFMRVNETLRSNSTLNYFYNVYFGSVDGSFRYYPGRVSHPRPCSFQ